MFYKNKITWMALLLLPIVTVGAVFAQVIKDGRSDVCGGSDLIRFAFPKPDRTELLIPEPYLDDERNYFHAVKDPIEFIKIVLRKDDISADCARESFAPDSIGDDFIYLTIRNYYPFSALLIAQKGQYPNYIKNENNFDVYRSDWFKKTGGLEGEGDLLVPNPKRDPDFIMICSRGFRSREIVGCRVKQYVTSNIVADYTIRQEDMQRLQIISENIHQKILSFLKTN